MPPLPLNLTRALLLFGLLASGCSSSAGASAQAIDGVYQSTGAYSWTAFHDGTYLLWNSSADCNTGSASAPAGCQHTGTFDFNADTSTLTLADSSTGEVKTFALSGLETQPATPATLTTQSVGNRRGALRIQGGTAQGTSLTNGSSSSLSSSAQSLSSGEQSLVTGFSASLTMDEEALTQESQIELTQEIDQNKWEGNHVGSCSLVPTQASTNQGTVPAPPPAVTATQQNCGS